MRGQQRRRPSPGRAAAPVACESLEHRTLLSGTAADAVDATATTTTDSTVDAAAAGNVNTNNGHHFHSPCHHLCWV